MLVLALTFIFSLTITAQNQMAPQGEKGQRNELNKHERPMISPEKRADRMAKDLGLNDAQKNEVQELLEKQDAKRHQQMEKTEKMRDEMKAKFEVERKTNDEALAKIIGTEKFEKWQSLRSERMQKMKERKEHGTKPEHTEVK